MSEDSNELETHSGLPKKLVKSIAVRIFRVEHPRKEWVAFPNHSQAQIQERYMQTARAIIHEIRPIVMDDVDAALTDAWEQDMSLSIYCPQHHSQGRNRSHGRA
jgi:hypothetical protein